MPAMFYLLSNTNSGKGQLLFNDKDQKKIKQTGQVNKLSEILINDQVCPGWGGELQSK